MKAVVYQGKEHIAIQQRPIPEPGPGEALIRVMRAGVCGTDMSILAGQHPRAKPSLIMGHEFVGRVQQVDRRRRRICSRATGWWSNR